MKIKLNLLAMMFIISTTLFMNYKLSQVGVPDELILALSLAYTILFPWRILTIKEGEDDDKTSK